MAPGNYGRHPNHTGTIPKTKVRNNCNVPQEAVTPTRRDMTANLVTTSLDWVPVSEYNTRTNYNGQSRKPANNSSDHELTDLDNSVSFESGFGRFVPVRPQPRALPLNVQNREGISSDQNDDGAGSLLSGHTLHPYAHQMQNGMNQHSNHAPAAVMIVNPTTPNAMTANVSQPYNATNQNRNNLTRNLNPARNNFEGNPHASNNNTTPPISNSRTATKTVNLINKMYEQGQGGFSNINDNNHVPRDSARAIGEAMVAACPDAAAVERRLGQIREYIRVTSSLVDTMRNSEDEDIVTRPVSAQSNGSAFSDNELWQNEIKNKMELSQMRLTALKQQQKRLLKYQEEAKQQLDEINRERQAQVEMQPSTSQDNFAGMQSSSFNYNQPGRMFAANQVGVATTLPHAEAMLAPAMDELGHPHSAHSQEFQVNMPSGEEAAGGPHSEPEDDEAMLNERGRMLQMKLRELQMKKQHMESLVSEFQKLQMATQRASTRNTYSSSAEDSGDDEPSRKCNKSSGNIKNEDPFKLMEIKAIKTALQKTKDLMRSVENYESEHLSSAHEDSFREMSNHSNIHDNKSEGGGSLGGWSNDGSLCRVRNTLPPRHKFTNEHHSQHHPQQLLHPVQHHAQQTGHEANIASLQELAQELRMETEKIMGERARLKDMISNKEVMRKQKKVNEEVRAGPSAAPGPAELRQLQLRALLADKQRELEALLNKEKVLSAAVEAPKINSESHTASIANQSYSSDHEEQESRSEQLHIDVQHPREPETFGGSGDSVLGARGLGPLPAHLGSVYGSDSDSPSRNNQRNRTRRRIVQERASEDNSIQSHNSNQNLRQEPRLEQANVHMVPPVPQNGEAMPAGLPYPHAAPPSWGSNKSNQDMRTNQFTQNSHSQTMDRLMGTPQMPFPPSMPFNMMMPYGMVGGCSCGCAMWGAWCWQQVSLQQREIHQLREQLTHLEERWRAEAGPHTLNNQVPPGNRANNYWDNFRSYSRQNLLSGSSKANAGVAHVPQPLAERSHNSIRTPPAPKRNTDPAGDPPGAAPAAPPDPAPEPDRHLHIVNPIPEIVQAHSNNLNSAPAKRKSSAKLPAKNSADRRNCALDYSQTSNVDIAGVSDPPNPNLASASREPRDKAASKLFHLLRENVYSEVTALIGVNEAHPDFLIQLFRELRPIESDALRQRVLQSIRGALEPERGAASARAEPESTTADEAPEGAGAAPPDRDVVRFMLSKGDELCTPEFLETLARDYAGAGPSAGSGAEVAPAERRLLERLAKYEGLRVCDVTADVIDDWQALAAEPTAGASTSAEAGGAAEPRPYSPWAEAAAGGAGPSREDKVDLLDCSEMHNGDLAEADQTCRAEPRDEAADPLPDVVDTDEVTPTEAEAEWLGLDRVPTRLHMEESSEKQKD